MRIDILVPVYVDIWNEGILKAAKKTMAPDIDLRVVNLEKGVPSMESAFDVAVAAHLVLEKAQQLESEGSDGVVLYCFKDPVIEACKEKLNIPVVGLRESSIALAGLIGEDIAVITSRKYSVSCYKRALKGKVKTVTCLDIPVLDLIDYNKVEQALDRKVAEVAAGGCDVVVLGCGSILGIDFKRIEQKYGLPIVIPLYAALAACDYLVRTGLSQSRLAFPSPENKVIK